MKSFQKLVAQKRANNKTKLKRLNNSISCQSPGVFRSFPKKQQRLLRQLSESMCLLNEFDLIGFPVVTPAAFIEGFDHE
jgi:hypothetical protein